MAENAKIRINVEVVNLEVNDNGDTIVLPVSDERLIQRLYAFIDNISKRANEMQELKDVDIVTVVNKDVSFHEFLHDEFNTLFGENAYEKVFGNDVVVGAEYILEFLDQVVPYITKHSANRSAKLNKYNANRVGSSL